MEKKQHYLILNKLLEYKSRYGNDAIVSDFNRGVIQLKYKTIDFIVLLIIIVMRFHFR